MSTATPHRETQADPFTPSTTTAAIPHTGTERQADQIVSGTRDECLAECEVQFEGGPDLETLASCCKKNPGHKKFTPVQEFLDSVKGDFDRKAIGDIRAVADRTVRVVVGKVSADRPDVYPGTSTPFPYVSYKGLNVHRYGTGYIDPYFKITGSDMPCPCPSCRTSEQTEMDYYEVTVVTASHLVYNDEEAAETEVELFYDTEEREGVKYLYGMWAWSNADRDYSLIHCVTHDADLVRRLRVPDTERYRLTSQQNNTKGLIISHPHGLSKHVSQGHFKHLNLSSIYPKHYRLTMRLPVTRSPPAVAHEPLPGAVAHEPVPGAVAVPVPIKHDDNYRYFQLPVGTHINITSFHGLRSIMKIVQVKTQSSSNSYVKLPNQTKIKLPGGELADWPHEAEINRYSSCLQLGYDTGTCPGSSGAPFLWQLEKGRMGVMSLWCHCGATGDTNISSYSYPEPKIS